MNNIYWTNESKELLYVDFIYHIDCLTAEANHYLCNNSNILNTMYILNNSLSDINNLFGYYSDLNRYVNIYLRKIRLPFIKAIVSNTIYEDKVMNKICNDILNLRKYVLKKYGK